MTVVCGNGTSRTAMKVEFKPFVPPPEEKSPRNSVSMFCGHNSPLSLVFGGKRQFAERTVQLSLPIRKPKPVPGCRAMMNFGSASYFDRKIEFLASDCGQFVPEAHCCHC